MTLLERYILKNTFNAFAACLVALTGVIWITQALRELDLLTGKGQTLMIFLTVTGLSLPALICLTGDAPKRFALTKKTIMVGRGPQCDLQIVTHTVSREHARLTMNGGVTLIEDLGSRNGVFVNAVRVDRWQLRQGDLVTIGETEFRFIESMAH